MYGRTYRAHRHYCRGYGSIDALNDLLHNYNEYIIGRMGIPYRKKKLSIISVIIDAPQNTISALTGKLGMIKGLSVKTVYSKN